MTATTFTDQVEEAVQAAWAAEGYVTEDGAKDHGKVREHVLEILRTQAKVLSRAERRDKAMTRGNLAKAVFPVLFSAAAGDDDDGLFVDTVQRKIESAVWQMTATDATGAVQRMVNHEMGNGYVMCRTALAPDRTPAVYITDDFALIREDVIKAGNMRLEKALRREVANLEMLQLRQPEHSKQVRSGFGRLMRTLTLTGNEQLALTAEAANGQGDDGDDGDDGDEG